MTQTLFRNLCSTPNGTSWWQRRASIARYPLSSYTDFVRLLDPHTGTESRSSIGGVMIS